MAKDTLERLRHRVSVYSKTEGKTEFGETTFSYEETQTVWAEILPTSGKEETLDGSTIQANVTHKITVRDGAIKNPRNDMFFVFRGQRYDILYFMPHYKRYDLIEFYCKLIIETEDDYYGEES